MASHYYGDQVYSFGLRIPAGGARVRSDNIWTLANDRVTSSGLLNADYSFGIVVHAFAEYFHNGFGVACRVAKCSLGVVMPMFARGRSSLRQWTQSSRAAEAPELRARDAGGALHAVVPLWASRRRHGGRA